VASLLDAEGVTYFSQALHNFASDPDYDSYASLIVAFAYSNTIGGWAAVNTIDYTQTVVNTNVSGYPGTLEPFVSYEPQIFNTMRVSNLTDFTLELNSMNIAIRSAPKTAYCYGAMSDRFQMVFLYQNLQK
jgi:hypothetical protein